ncbi:MAG: formate-dependent phosphoribosylglycinamide formyltransferase, partial [Myxococcota bacterium]|nr:formate-dependent phosphoribosylglycinamide formyltransferase [Myxococcota bacterium]
MLLLGVPGTSGAKKVMMLGSGELGKEVVIEAQRLGVEVVAVDRYAGAPAMQVAHKHHVIDMQDATALRALVEQEAPDLIVPEVEAIATDELAKLEQDGFHVIPTARATQLTMDREGIRKLAAEELGLPTSPYAFAADEESYLAAVREIGVPCVVKPVMSSSGKGQSIVREMDRAIEGWKYALEGSRGKSQRVIIEGFVPFDTEITLLTVRHSAGTSFCAPVGHRQIDGDYRESWQPEVLSATVLEEAERQAKVITDVLGGRGLFGVEFFIQGEQVFFSELSP